MNTSFTSKTASHSTATPVHLFKSESTEPSWIIADCAKHISQHDNSIAYIMNTAGEASHNHHQHIVIVTLAAMRDMHWSVKSYASETFDAPAGSVFIVPKDSDFLLRWPMESDYIQLALDEDMLDDLQDLTGALQLKDLFPHPSRQPNPKVLQIAHLMRTELQKNAPVCAGYMKALLAVLLAQLIQNHSFLRQGQAKNAQGGLTYQASRQIEAYLRDNYKRKVSINDMANVIGVSGGHFLTSFRESFGQTPHQFLMMLRLNAAEEMLLESNICLAEIADRTGFSSQSHMTTALKKCRMTTPGEVRRKRLTALKSKPS